MLSNGSKATGLCFLVCFPPAHFTSRRIEIAASARQWIQIESIGASFPFSSQRADLRYQRGKISMHILGKNSIH